MLVQAPGPIGAWLDLANHVDEENKGIVKTTVFLRIQVGDDRGRRALRQLNGNGETAVPKSGVVGA